jgi:hypothetical protein
MIIDETHDSIIEQSKCLSYQWFGEYIFRKNESDIWLSYGLSHYISSLFVKKHFGLNEYKYRLKKDFERIFMLDVNQPPLFNLFSHNGPTGHNDATTPVLEAMTGQASKDFMAENLNFVKLKAPVIIYLLEKHMGKNMMQKVIFNSEFPL